MTQNIETAQLRMSRVLPASPEKAGRNRFSSVVDALA